MPVASLESVTPSPSASVVVSVALVPTGAALMNTPPSTSAPILSAEPDCSRFSGLSRATTAGSPLRVVTR